MKEERRRKWEIRRIPEKTKEGGKKEVERGEKEEGNE